MATQTYKNLIYRDPSETAKAQQVADYFGIKVADLIQIGPTEYAKSVQHSTDSPIKFSAWANRVAKQLWGKKDSIYPGDGDYIWLGQSHHFEHAAAIVSSNGTWRYVLLPKKNLDMVVAGLGIGGVRESAGAPLPTFESFMAARVNESAKLKPSPNIGLINGVDASDEALSHEIDDFLFIYDPEKKLVMTLAGDDDAEFYHCASRTEADKALGTWAVGKPTYLKEMTDAELRKVGIEQ